MLNYVDGGGGGSYAVDVVWCLDADDDYNDTSLFMACTMQQTSFNIFRKTS